MKPEVFMMFLVMVGLAITGMILFSRNAAQRLLHQERMAALEKGAAVPSIEPERPWSPRVYLLRGMIWSFCGAALIVCLLGLSTATHQPESASGMAFEAKRLSDMLEISRDEARQLVAKDHAEGRDRMPASVALLGLLPLSVGLAYLLFYYTDASRKV